MKEKRYTQMEITTITGRTFGSDLGLCQIDKSVLVALTWHIYKDTSKRYWCNPGHSLLCAELDLKPRRIVQAIKTLSEKGYIIVTKTRLKNNYEINLPLILEKHQLWKDSFKKDKPKPDTKDYVKTRPMIIEQETEEDDDYPY